jgi:hypothetical protein
MYKTKNKRNKRHKRTRKYYGGSADVNTNSGATFKPNEGVFNILGSKLSGFASSAFNYIEEKGLRAAGLKKIQDVKTDANGNTVVEDGINKASGFVSNAINNVNNTLKSPEVQGSINAAAQDFSETGAKLLGNFNQLASSPAFKEQVKIAADNASDYAEIVVDAMDEPINKAMDNLNEAGTKATSGAVAGLIKVSTDAMAAVPGAGAIVEVGKMLNDGSKAVGDIVDAASNATETLSKIVTETSENIDKGLDNLEAKKQRVEGLTGQKFNIPITNASAAVSNASSAVTNKMTNASNNITNAVSNKMTNALTNVTQTGGLKKIARVKEQIGGRINDSLAEFSDPISYQTGILKGGGNNKTKKSILVSGKDKKSRRVHFST